MPFAIPFIGGLLAKAGAAGVGSAVVGAVKSAAVVQTIDIALDRIGLSGSELPKAITMIKGDKFSRDQFVGTTVRKLAGDTTAQYGSTDRREIRKNQIANNQKFKLAEKAAIKTTLNTSKNYGKTFVNEQVLGRKKPATATAATDLAASRPTTTDKKEQTARIERHYEYDAGVQRSVLTYEDKKRAGTATSADLDNIERALKAADGKSLDERQRLWERTGYTVSGGNPALQDAAVRYMNTAYEDEKKTRDEVAMGYSPTYSERIPILDSPYRSVEEELVAIKRDTRIGPEGYYMQGMEDVFREASRPTDRGPLNPAPSMATLKYKKWTPGDVGMFEKGMALDHMAMKMIGLDPRYDKTTMRADSGSMSAFQKARSILATMMQKDAATQKALLEGYRMDQATSTGSELLDKDGEFLRQFVKNQRPRVIAREELLMARLFPGVSPESLEVVDEQLQSLYAGLGMEYDSESFERVMLANLTGEKPESLEHMDELVAEGKASELEFYAKRGITPEMLKRGAMTAFGFAADFGRKDTKVGSWDQSPAIEVAALASGPTSEQIAYRSSLQLVTEQPNPQYNAAMAAKYPLNTMYSTPTLVSRSLIHSFIDDKSRTYSLPLSSDQAMKTGVGTYAYKPMPVPSYVKQRVEPVISVGQGVMTAAL